MLKMMCVSSPALILLSGTFGVGPVLSAAGQPPGRAGHPEATALHLMMSAMIFVNSPEVILLGVLTESQSPRHAAGARRAENKNMLLTATKDMEVKRLVKVDITPPCAWLTA